MSGWRGRAVPLLIVPAVLAGCQTPPSGRIALDLPVLRTAQRDAPSPWNWWTVRAEPVNDEIARRVQVTSLPELNEAEFWNHETTQPDPPLDGEPGWLPPPVREPIPIEIASDPSPEPDWPCDGLTPLRPHAGPAAADWTPQP